MAESEEEIKSLLIKVKGEKTGSKLNIHEMKITRGVQSHHFMALVPDLSPSIRSTVPGTIMDQRVSAIPEAII